jgi:O-antigen/teichoic acid export membrane protein
MREFLFNAGWILGLRLANVPLQFVLFVMITWHYSLAQVGTYALFNAAWFIARQLGPLGMEQSSLRFIPALLASGKDDQARWFEHRARQLVFVVLGAIAVAAGFLIFVLDISRLTGVSGPQFAIGLAALPGYALVALMAGQFRARGRIRAGQWPDSILVPLTAMLVIQAAQTTGLTSLFWLLAAHSAAIWCAAGTYWLLSRGHLSGRLARPAADQIRDIRRTSLTIALGGGVSVLASRLPLIFVSAILGSAATGLYEAAQRIGALGTLGTWAAGAAVSPMLSEAHARNQKRRLQDLLIASSWTALLPALIIFLGLIPGGSLVLYLFGPDYPAAHGALVALAGFAAINASAGLTSNTFNMTGHETIVLRFNGAQLLAILIMAPPLIHLAGITGAGLAVLIAAILRDVGMGFLLPGKLGLAPGVWSRLGAGRAFGFALAKVSGR